MADSVYNPYDSNSLLDLVKIDAAKLDDNSLKQYNDALKNKFNSSTATEKQLFNNAIMKKYYNPFTDNYKPKADKVDLVKDLINKNIEFKQSQKANADSVKALRKNMDVKTAQAVLERAKNENSDVTDNEKLAAQQKIDADTFWKSVGDTLAKASRRSPLSSMANGIIPYLSEFAASTQKARDPMGRSAGLEAQADLHMREAADYQKLAQEMEQIANRDYKQEAENDAAANATIKNAQAIANMGNASAGAAALNKDVEAADYNTKINRQDTMRKEAMDAKQSAYDSKQIAAQERTDAKGYDYTAHNQQAAQNMARRLSSGPIANAINYSKDKDTNDEDTNDENSDESTKKYTLSEALDIFRAASNYGNTPTGSAVTDETNENENK